MESSSVMIDWRFEVLSVSTQSLNISCRPTATAATVSLRAACAARTAAKIAGSTDKEATLTIDGASMQMGF